MLSRILNSLLLGALAAVFAPEAMAQGCAMCAQNAAAAGEKAAAAINAGILLLLLPTLGLFCGVFFLAFRRNNSNPTD